MQSELEQLNQLSLEIIQEEADIKMDAGVLSDRKKRLKERQSEYMRRSRSHFESELNVVSASGYVLNEPHKIA